MAHAMRFVCGHCRRASEAWSDGNPYYIDERGKKRYAYHPNHTLLDRCIGNDLPHLCLGCGKKFNVDTRGPVAACPRCKAADIADIADTCRLGGCRCPYCKRGKFAADADFHCVS